MTEVLVVGAGPTGLVTAIQLRRFGVACRVIDRADGPATTSRALGCHARTLEALADLGAAGPLVRASRPLRGATYYRGERPVARMIWEPVDGPFPYPLVLPQAELEAILRARLAELGAEVEWGRALADVRQGPDGVVAELSDGTGVAAGWLVGCDGARSRVREAVGIAFVGAAYPEVYYLGDLALDLRGGGVDDSRIWLGGERAILAIPLDDRGTWRVFADVTPDDPYERVPPPTLEVFQRLLDDRAFGPGKVRVLGSTWLSTFRLQRRQAERYREGRVFLAGDAAHAFPPFGGQGMNTGIQDAYNLAWKLAAVVRGWGRPELLDTYHVERHPACARVIHTVDRSTRLLGWRHPLAGRARELLLRTFLRSRVFCRAICRRSSGLALHYRQGTWLSVQVGRTRGPRAGDRAPDGPLGDGRLFAARDGTRFTLLLFVGAGGPPTLAGVDPARVQVLPITPARDPDGALRRRYAAGRGALVLVRPDGYIGFRGELSAGAALGRYLARIFADAPVRGRVAAAAGG